MLWIIKTNPVELLKGKCNTRIVGFLYTLVQRDRAENKKESKEHGYGLRNPGIR